MAARNVERAQAAKSQLDEWESNTNWVLKELQRLKEENVERARRNDNLGRPNMASADRFFVVLFELALLRLRERKET